MTTEQAKYIVQVLAGKGISFEDGLTDHEVLQVETKFNFKFPADLKLFLQVALPVSGHFVNWRLGLKSKEEADKILLRLEGPLEGILFDLQSNSFWVDRWGKNPENVVDKISIAKKNYATYPKLIPIYSHRYIPSRPNEPGNPVFSVYQTDIIFYGYDLSSYFANEFSFKLPLSFAVLEQPKRTIEFWSERAG